MSKLHPLGTYNCTDVLDILSSLLKSGNKHFKDVSQRKYNFTVHKSAVGLNSVTEHESSRGSELS